MAHRIERLTAAQLASLIHPSAPATVITPESNDESDAVGRSDNETKPRVLIVDVRDDDFVGGNIPKAWNVPSVGFDAALPNIVKRARDESADLIVFHCMQSQVRGPKAARKFSEHIASSISQSDDQTVNTIPKVAILNDGFEGWIDYLVNQRQSGEKVTHLIESYDRRAWQVKLD